jgi:hypothetical protein
MTAATPPAPPARPRRSRARFLLPLLGAAWVVTVPALVLDAFGQSLAFFGESPTAAEMAATERLLEIAAAVAVGLPLLGLVVALALRSRSGTSAFVVLLVLGLAFALLVGWNVHLRHRNDPPPPSAPVTTCQEHSGGDTRCPGG